MQTLPNPAAGSNPDAVNTLPSHTPDDQTFERQVATVRGLVSGVSYWHARAVAEIYFGGRDA